MKDRMEYLLEYTGGLRVALEGERNLWSPTEITQHFCLLNAIDTLAHEVISLNERVKHLQSSQSSETEEA